MKKQHLAEEVLRLFLSIVRTLRKWIVVTESSKENVVEIHILGKIFVYNTVSMGWCYKLMRMLHKMFKQDFTIWR